MIPLTLLFLAQKRNLLIPLELSRVMHQGIAKSYGVVTAKRELPHRWTYYVDAEGKILYIDRSVNTHSAGADVAARLKRLGVPALSK